jgi:hypothetical protein
MKKISSFLFVVAICAAAGTAAHVSGTVLKSVETSLDERFNRLWEDNAFAVTRPSRGIYLDGYGAVFTVDVSPLITMTSMMHPNVTKDEAAKAHKIRVERIPQLKQAVRVALADAAASLDSVPLDDQVTVVVFLTHHQWEDVTGTPGQLTFQGKKKALLEARRAGGTALAQAVQITEN